MSERFKVVCTMQGDIQVLWFTFTFTFTYLLTYWATDTVPCEGEWGGRLRHSAVNVQWCRWADTCVNWQPRCRVGGWLMESPSARVDHWAGVTSYRCRREDAMSYSTLSQWTDISTLHCAQQRPVCLHATLIHCIVQGGPAKVRPTYIFDGNLWMHS